MVEAELDDFEVPELPPLPHAGLTAKQQEDRRMLVGRMVAYHGPKSPPNHPFTIGQIKGYETVANKVCLRSKSSLIMLACLR